MKIIKNLKGYSGSQVFLMQDQITFVRKIGNIDRNLERYGMLSKLGLSVPRVLTQNPEFYDMEYIPNLDIKNYLFKNHVQVLFNFIKDTIYKLSENSYNKDYTDIYRAKLKNIDFSPLIFDQQDLLDKLPAVLPCSEYHGDFTLENILYNINKKEFTLIDPLTTEYDSYVFDLAKLRQDVDCKWFIRQDQIHLDTKLKKLSETLEQEFSHYSNQYLLILMLLRVLPYAQGSDRKFIIEKANKLWK
jgi:tRNA A-37 threonylcarbamoyl transferase component Bud32